MSRLYPVFAVLAIACVACAVPVPQPPRLTIAIHAKARVQTPPPPQADLDVDVGVEAEGVYVEAEVEPPQPTEPVALEGAAVVEFFGIPLEGTQDVVFVLDRSGSMEELALGQIAQLGYPQGAPAASPSGPEQPPMPPPQQGPRKIDIAHAELVSALERLPAGTRMNVVFFNNRLEAHQAGITALQETDRDDVIEFVRETFPYGPTALAPAMRTAFLMNAKRIVLLSDGLGNVGGDAASVLRDAREAMRGGVRIDTIGLGLDQDAWLLQTLAHESSGIYQQL